MKVSKLAKDVTFGIGIATEIKASTNRTDMTVLRCILCGDIRNIASVLKFVGIMPDRYNKAIQTGIFIELNR